MQEEIDNSEIWVIKFYNRCRRVYKETGRKEIIRHKLKTIEFRDDFSTVTSMIDKNIGKRK